MHTPQLNVPAVPGEQNIQALERRARFFWVSVVVGLLGMQIAIGVTAIVLATSDKTVAVIPDYYQSAVNWDVTRRSLQLTEKLGWTTDCSVGALEQGYRNLTIVVQDRDEEPVADLRIFAEYFHHSRATEQKRVLMNESAPGLYSAVVPIKQTGLWQLNLRLEGEHGIAAKRSELRVQ